MPDKKTGVVTGSSSSRVANTSKPKLSRSKVVAVNATPAKVAPATVVVSTTTLSRPISTSREASTPDKQPSSSPAAEVTSTQSSAEVQASASAVDVRY